MTTPHCYATVDLVAIRAALLTSAGQPSGGASNGYVTSETIKLGISAEVVKGDDLEQKNGVGAICRALKKPDKVKRLNLSLDLCVLDAELMDVLAGFDPFTSGGHTIGAQWPSVTADPPNVCVEAWSHAWDNDEAGVPPFTTPNAAYIHWVFPRTQWRAGDLSLESQFQPTPCVGESFENSRITADGPWNDWPAAIGAAGGVTRIGGWFYDATLPTAQCGYQAVPVSAS